MSDIKLDFPGIQVHLTKHEIEQIVDAIISAKTLTMGPRLEAFEDDFARYLGSKYAFGIANGTAALELAGQILNVKQGDEVILPAHTFTATALPFLRRNAKLVFADIDPKTFVMDVNDVRRKITKHTRVVVPVHLYGLPVNMLDLVRLANEYGLSIVEDCAQSPGASFNNQKVGTFGDFGCFSFHSQKNITTLGEGGMIVTNNDEYAEKILGLRKIGQRPFASQQKYWLPAMSNIIEAVPGVVPNNFALGEIQALAGNLILRRLDRQILMRYKMYEKITNSLLHHKELVFQHFPKECLSAIHLLPARFNGQIFSKTRDDLIELLYEKHGGEGAVREVCDLILKMHYR
ncbi:DegT/DnrJ/EryC1/StrS family aminotransferase [candidate division KSB1 bacterium]|nr:DegT/DnrJ/EryC1/StrS family aminotransferase [candidate division KSB1 bacterium]RQW09099.1 MAG: DegT/DnrJ/EryC1/StrS family aminotransferase [candidate division KSB1 bacterium]